MGRLVYAVYTSVKPKISLNFFGILLVFLKGLETLGCRITLVGRAYHNLFYKKMVAKEIKQANLENGAKVVHIGCGSLPLTAVELSAAGYFVEAVDIDPKAADNARTYLNKFAARGSFAVNLADGAARSYADTDAVWVSLNVYFRELVLKQIYKSLKSGSKMAYRNPRGFNGYFYPKVEPRQIAQNCCYTSSKQTFGKETVVITKP